MELIKKQPITVKLIMLLILPVALMFYYTLESVQHYKRQYDESVDIENLVEIIKPCVEVIRNLQNERTQAYLYFANLSSPDLSVVLPIKEEQLTPFQLEVDKAIEVFKKVSVAYPYVFDNSVIKDTFERQVQRWSQELAKLGALRLAFKKGNEAQKEGISQYNQMIQEGLHTVQTLLFAIDVPHFLSSFNGLNHWLRYIEEVDAETYLIAEGLINPQMLSHLPQRIEDLKSWQKEYLESAKIMCPATILDAIQANINRVSKQEIKQLEKVLLESAQSGAVKSEVFLKWLQAQKIEKELLFSVTHEMYNEWNDSAAQLKFTANRAYIAAIISNLFAVAVSLFLFIWLIKLIKNQLRYIENITDNLAKGDFTQVVEVDGQDEIVQLAKTINNSLTDQLQSMIIQIRRTNDGIANSTEELIGSSRRVGNTAKKQVQLVQEISSTINDSAEFVQVAASKAQEISQMAHSTEVTVEKGLEMVHVNQSKMENIKETNVVTIQGIKLLGDQISTIWDIVNMINAIADQTKIIAFNAELEASAAGEAGKNFQIVATEIRRLADNTVTSTNEIKTKIQEIQKASDLLVLKAEEETSKIQEGWESSRQLGEIFATIAESSKVSVNSAKSVTNTIQQQLSAFEQVTSILRNVTENVKKLDFITEGNNKVVIALKGIVNRLQTLCNQFKTVDIKDDKIFIAWQPGYDLGVASMDEQHKQLVRLMNDLFDAMQKKEVKPIVDILDGLVQYTEYHFEQEELLMELNNYPELEGHAEIHHGFSGKIERFKQSYLEGKEDLSEELLDFLQKWLINHILVQDKAYAPHIKKFPD
jgi:hemerythrin-like metal-binding protein